MTNATRAKNIQHRDWSQIGWFCHSGHQSSRDPVDQIFGRTPEWLGVGVGVFPPVHVALGGLTANLKHEAPRIRFPRSRVADRMSCVRVTVHPAFLISAALEVMCYARSPFLRPSLDHLTTEPETVFGSRSFMCCTFFLSCAHVTNSCRCT